MSTDYKNLFNKKRDYSNLFDSASNQADANKVQEPNMKYKNLFEGTNKIEPSSTEQSTKNVAPKNNYSTLFGTSEPTPRAQAPAKKVDPRHQEIQAIDPTISTNSVIHWIETFEDSLKRLSTDNQKLSEEELELAQEFTVDRNSIRQLFVQIQSIISVLKAPEKKKGFLNKLLRSDEDFELSSDIINDVISQMKSTLLEFKNKQKYSSNMFIKADIDNIQRQIMSLKVDSECALVACKYLITKGDYKAEARLDRIMKINQLIQISEATLMNSYNMFQRDFDDYEDMKNVTVPLLYIKLQNLMSSTLDPEALNLINKINKIN